MELLFWFKYIELVALPKSICTHIFHCVQNSPGKRDVEPISQCQVKDTVCYLSNKTNMKFICLGKFVLRNTDRWNYWNISLN